MPKRLSFIHVIDLMMNELMKATWTNAQTRTSTNHCIQTMSSWSSLYFTIRIHKITRAPCGGKHTRRKQRYNTNMPAAKHTATCSSPCKQARETSTLANATGLPTAETDHWLHYILNVCQLYKQRWSMNFSSSDGKLLVQLSKAAPWCRKNLRAA